MHDNIYLPFNSIIYHLFYDRNLLNHTKYTFIIQGITGSLHNLELYTVNRPSIEYQNHEHSKS